MGKLSVPYIGKESILMAYDTLAKYPYFSIWCNNAIIYSYSGDTKEEGAEMLEKILNINASLDQVFTVRLHNSLPDKKDTFSTKDLSSSILYCSLVDASDKIAATDPNSYMLQQISQRLNAIESDIKAKHELVEEEVEEEEESEKMINAISGIVNSPLIGLLVNFLQPKQTVTHLAGVPENDIEAILNTLFNKGVTVDHLRKLSEFPADKIKMLINLL
jgi:hypothetical protein